MRGIYNSCLNTRRLNQSSLMQLQRPYSLIHPFKQYHPNIFTSYIEAPCPYCAHLFLIPTAAFSYQLTISKTSYLISKMSFQNSKSEHSMSFHQNSHIQNRSSYSMVCNCKGAQRPAYYCMCTHPFIYIFSVQSSEDAAASTKTVTKELPIRKISK